MHGRRFRELWRLPAPFSFPSGALPLLIILIIVIGGIVVLTAVILVVIMCQRHHKRAKEKPTAGEMAYRPVAAH